MRIFVFSEILIFMLDILQSFDKPYIKWYRKWIGGRPSKRICYMNTIELLFVKLGYSCNGSGSDGWENGDFTWNVDSIAIDWEEDGQFNEKFKRSALDMGKPYETGFCQIHIWICVQHKFDSAPLWLLLLLLLLTLMVNTIISLIPAKTFSAAMVRQTTLVSTSWQTQNKQTAYKHRTYAICADEHNIL